MEIRKKNVMLAVALIVMTLLVALTVFGWRLSHRLPAMPQGSVYGQAYLPVTSVPSTTPATE